MAQLKGFPFVEKGHIDEVTIYNRDGKLLLRNRHNNTRRHPRLSELQIRQCSRFVNNIRLWNAFPPKQRPYFQWRRGCSSCYNTFLTYAMNAHPVYLTKQMVSMSACVLTDVMVSQGSLMEITVSHDGVAPITHIRLGGLTIDNSTTVRQLAKAIVVNNYGYYYGDIVRYYMAEQRLVGTNSLPMVRIYCKEVVLDPWDETPLHQVVQNSPGFAQRDGRLAASQEVVGGMAWVHLRHTDNEIQVSTQRLVCNNDTLMQQYGSEEAFAEACKSYRGN